LVLAQSGTLYVAGSFDWKRLSPSRNPNMRTVTGPATSLRAAATKLFQIAIPEGRPGGRAARVPNIFVKRFKECRI